MDKIILKAQNREELDSMIKRSLTLENDETFKINVVKEPKKILFFNIKGVYEIEIVKKHEIEKNKKSNKQEKKNEIKDFKKEIKKDRKSIKENFKKEKNKSENRRPTDNKINSSFSNNNNNIEIDNVFLNKNKESIKEVKSDDVNYDRIRSFIKEFIVNSKLDIRIVQISRDGERYIVNVDGKDIRYLIGEKGSTLNSVEYLLSSVKSFKNIKVVIDSNNYKQKREESLRDLARKKGKKVLETGRNIKLNPMSARERKIIHEEISFIKGLKTESMGEEPKRYLVIKRTKD
ncbi:KH domain-containing protein [Leptotrichia sp. OH3620_COT-345]|uniref:Jag family protein n=1 Tax=Leptotrichia sp. OH3620_COT-345 TaxID=2491048 RepID=UPI000F650B9E|nr:R3H domain-containing nucleic acid-binding protein [Leptotrichia sp. OH3620_COT-345]RRD40737.1 KH domain-containing protein [Leptotrichia sp. OH3620_COT-345]